MDIPPHRRWMYNRLHPKRNGYTNEFIIGMEEFMKFVCEQPIYLSEGLIRCPCIRCKNEKYHTPDLVNVHLYRKGFIPHYWYWTAHGEVAPPINPSIDIHLVGSNSAGHVDIDMQPSSSNWFQ